MIDCASLRRIVETADDDALISFTKADVATMERELSLGQRARRVLVNIRTLADFSGGLGAAA